MRKRFRGEAARMTYGERKLFFTKGGCFGLRDRELSDARQVETNDEDGTRDCN